MAKILLTGSEGVIAKELKAKLDGHQLLCIDKKPGDNHICLDLSQDYFAKLKEITLFEPEIIFHLAASFERTEETPDFYERNLHDNMLASLILNRELTKMASVKCFVFASSYLTYDQSLYLNRDVPMPLNEGMVVKPRNLCGMSKLYTEYELNFIKTHILNGDWGRQKMRLVNARIFRVYGHDSQDIVSRSIRWTKVGVPITVWRPDNSFDYIHARDVAEGLKRLAFSEADGVYNLGTGRSTTIEKLMTLIGAKVVMTTPDHKYHNLPHEQSLADMEKFHKVTGWVPQITIEKGVEDLRAYYNA